MPNQLSKDREWYVTIPFSDLHKLTNQLETLDQLQRENAQLRNEMDGLRNMFHELLERFGELRRQVNGR